MGNHTGKVVRSSHHSSEDGDKAHPSNYWPITLLHMQYMWYILTMRLYEAFNSETLSKLQNGLDQDTNTRQHQSPHRCNGGQHTAQEEIHLAYIDQCPSQSPLTTWGK